MFVNVWRTKAACLASVCASTEEKYTDPVDVQEPGQEENILKFQLSSI